MERERKHAHIFSTRAGQNTRKWATESPASCSYTRVSFSSMVIRLLGTYIRWPPLSLFYVKFHIIHPSSTTSGSTCLTPIPKAYKLEVISHSTPPISEHLLLSYFPFLCCHLPLRLCIHRGRGVASPLCGDAVQNSYPLYTPSKPPIWTWAVARPMGRLSMQQALTSQTPIRLRTSWERS